MTREEYITLRKSNNVLNILVKYYQDKTGKLPDMEQLILFINMCGKQLVDLLIERLDKEFNLVFLIKDNKILNIW